MKSLLIFIFSVVLFFPFGLLGQHIKSPPGDCLNAGFENGTIAGYETFYGFIDDFGNLQINSPGAPYDQFEIMNKDSELQGYDGNAWINCTVNHKLPIVPPGSGRHTLRLGDLDGGSKAARIVLEFEVTNEVSFFLLNYAVVLEDPNHDYYEQPRFELYIKDVNGVPLPCGEYSVRAALEIPGFESCFSDLRVRPWTTAGFELQSYLGQTIRIEILTTDCSRGGHGGYAYLDASCKPLELVLDGYCPGSETATYTITDGFEKYLWSTGDTTNEITIQDPTAGSIYSVTLTSATGCTLVLTDTLPPIQNLELANFNELGDTSICSGESFWVYPTGDNLPFIYCAELGYFADSFLLSPLDTTTYTFLSRDDFGCMTDTVTTTVNVVNLDFDVIKQDPCGSENSGEIFITSILGNAPFTVLLNGEQYVDQLSFSGLSPGNYQIYLTDANGCTTSKSLTLTARTFPMIDTVLITPASCGNDNAEIEILPKGNISQHQYSLDNISYVNTNTFTALQTGTYWVFIKNQYGCIDSAQIMIGTFELPKLESVISDSTICGLSNGKLTITASGGYGQISYSINGVAFQSNPVFSNLAEGSYTVYIKDQAGCVESLPVMVHAVGVPEILDIKITHATCDEDNGEVEILVNNGRPPYEYNVSGQVTNYEGSFRNLSPGAYIVIIADQLSCILQSGFDIKKIPPPVISGFDFIHQECGNNFVAGTTTALPGVRPFRFSFDGGLTWQSDSISYRINTGSIQLSVIDATGCRADSLIPLIDDIHFYVPNVFSPDNDGINDLFIPSITRGAEGEVKRYQIFDRWGSLKFEASGFSVHEDDPWWKGVGIENKIVEPGVYVYIIEILLNDGRMICRNGDVTVVY